MIQKFKNKLQADSTLKELFKGSSITFFIKLLGMLTSYLVVLLISRKYGAEGVGIYGLSHRLINSIAIFCALGLNISVLRYVGEFNTKKNAQAYLRKLFKYILQLSLPFAVLISIIIYSLASIIAEQLFENPVYTEAIQIVAIILPFFTLNIIYVEFIRGLKLLKVSEYLRSINTYLIILILLFLPFLNFGELKSVYAMAIGMTVTFIISLQFIFIILKNSKLKAEVTSFSKKKLMSTSMPMMVISVSSFILAFAGTFFLELYSTTSNVGIFNVCLMLSQLVSLALTVVNTISAPKFSELFWSNKKEELKKVIHQSSKLIFWSSMMVSIVLILASKYVLALFGNEFIIGQNILLILVLGQIINAATGSVGVFLNMTGNQKVLRNIIFLTTIVVLIGYYMFVPTYGMIGVALVSISGTIFLNVTSAIYVYKELNYTTFYIPFINIKND